MPKYLLSGVSNITIVEYFLWQWPSTLLAGTRLSAKFPGVRWQQLSWWLPCFLFGCSLLWTRLLTPSFYAGSQTWLQNFPHCLMKLFGSNLYKWRVYLGPSKSFCCGAVVVCAVYVCAAIVCQTYVTGLCAVTSMFLSCSRSQLVHLPLILHGFVGTLECRVCCLRCVIIGHPAMTFGYNRKLKAQVWVGSRKVVRLFVVALAFTFGCGDSVSSIIIIN